jgi:uncharacterized delta-60 repeat protein
MHSPLARPVAIVRSRLAPALLALALVCWLTPPASAQSACVPADPTPGSLDSCFGTGGRVVTTVNFATGSCYAYDVAVQPDGRVVVAAFGYNYPSGTGSDHYVLRYNTDGSFDGSFGSGGVARLGFSGGVPFGMAIQPDGKIVVCGDAPFSGQTNGFSVARLTPDGSLDATFGQNGRVVFNFEKGKSATCQTIALQSNGFIVLAGKSEGNFAAARLTSFGALDPGFNDTGKLLLKSTRNTIQPNYAAAVAIQTVTVGGVPQEKIVLVANQPNVSGVLDFATLRLNPNGTLDTSFGSGGKVVTDFAGYDDQVKGVAIDASGRVVVAGFATTAGPIGTMYAVARYTASGQLDLSFGSGGKALAGTRFRNRLYGVAIQGDGKIVASGLVESDAGAVVADDFATVRFEASGALDATFGPDGTGIVITDFEGAGDEAYGGVALAPDGGILAAGMARRTVAGGALVFHIAAARYLP